MEIQEYVQKINEMVEALETEIEKKQKLNEKGIRILQRTKNDLIKLSKNAYKLKKRKYNRKEGALTYFTKECNISEELQKFLMITPDEKVTPSDIIRGIIVYIRLDPDEKRENFLRWKHLNKKNRNLQDPKKRNRILPDKKLSDLLDYEKYISDVEKSEIAKKIGTTVKGEYAIKVR